MNLFLENDTAFKSSAAAGAAVAVQTTAVCPRCDTLLDEHIVSGEGAFVCPSCQGWWVPEGVLTRLHETHRGYASIPLDETSLYDRAAKARSKRDEQAASCPRRRQGSSVGLLYWFIMFGIVSLVIGLITGESVRRAIAKGHWAAKVDGGLFILALGVIGGLALLVYGFRLNHRKRLIETTPTSPIRSLAIGLAEITGKAEAAGATLSAPFSAMPCVFSSIK